MTHCIQFNSAKFNDCEEINTCLRFPKTGLNVFITIKLHHCQTIMLDSFELVLLKPS